MSTDDTMDDEAAVPTETAAPADDAGSADRAAAQADDAAASAAGAAAPAGRVRRVAAAARSKLSQAKRSPLAGAALSFVWPGLGQFAMGRRVAALVFTIPAIAFVLWVLLQLNQGAVFFAASLWDGTYAATVIAVVLAFGAWRAASVAHAAYLGMKGRRPRKLDYGVAGVLVAAIVAMHGLFVAGAWTWYQTAQAIQSNDLLAQVYAAAASQDPSPSVSLEPSDSPPPATPTPEPTPEPSPTANKNPDRITFLIAGEDFQTGRDSGRTDTLMVVSLNMKTETATMISVPRDTSNFPLYYGGVVGPTFKINTLLNMVSAKKLSSPDEPMKTLENEIGYIVGIPIDYYAFLDMDGFAKMITALGGIDIVNLRPIDDPGTGIQLGIGPVHLDGPTAVLYVRSRENGGSDYLRAGRQQALLVAIEKKVLSPSGLSRLTTLLNLAGSAIATDFPLKTARNYVSAVQHVTTIDSCVLGPPYSWMPPMSTTGGTWTSRLDLYRVANLSVEFFGQDSLYYGQSGVEAAPCGK
jgi:LCP family protein required for cell wall assembly